MLKIKKEAVKKNIRFSFGRNYKILITFTGIALTASIAFLISWAGSLNPSAPPADTVYNLEQIYCKLNGTGCGSTSYGVDSPANPAGTMHTLQQIWDATPDFKDTPGNAATTDVRSGKTFYTNSITRQTGTLECMQTSLPSASIIKYGNTICGVAGTYAKMLSFTGATHNEQDCTVTAGGTIYDTGSGTICRISASSCPSGWAQAANWQRYSAASWGGDPCGRHLSTGPATWSNVQAVLKAMGAFYNNYTGFCACSSYWGVNFCGSGAFACDPWGGGGGTHCYQVSITYNGSTTRVEIGCI